MFVDNSIITPKIEAILFASGNPISLVQIARALEIEQHELWEALEDIISGYNKQDRGLCMVRIEDSLQLCTRPEFEPTITRALENKKTPKLSSAALEVLAVVAYNQPVTRAFIEQIRGVDSSGVLATLVERGLIMEKGRLDAPGQPYLFVTTQQFMRIFGLQEMSELPSQESIQKPLPCGAQVTENN
jgi:segregation and condensation protein B